MNTEITWSPHFVDPEKFTGKECSIAQFASRIVGWYLSPAKILMSSRHNGFAVLMLLVHYFPMIANLSARRHKDAADAFVAGVEIVLCNKEKLRAKETVNAVAFYRQCASGLFVKNPAGIEIIIDWEMAEPFDFSCSPVRANPHSVFIATSHHFEKYIGTLRERKTLPFGLK